MAKEITPHIEEQIRTRAYFLWEADGRPHGRDWEYWIKAQQEFSGATGETETKPAAAPVRKAAVASAPEKVPASTSKRRTSRSTVYA